MLVPVVMYYIVIHYFPIYGLVIAFKDFTPFKGIGNSAWVGMKHFEAFFNSYYFGRLLRNTVLISFYDLIFGFPAPIILALILNEVKRQAFKRFVQTVSYLPHFISIVVVAGMIIDFSARDGVINQVLAWFGSTPVSFLQNQDWFRTIFVGSNIWQGIGWGSIIYLAALSAISPELYEASRVDGANRWSQMLHITIPGIMPTIIIMLILRVGHMMDVGYEKVILLYNPSIYETADVISSFIYRKGLLEMSYSYSAAVGLFNSVINFALLLSVNRMARKTGTSLW
ncbi:ABC transporter permease [Paenibacillus thalictri]|uniref:Sugar ABC transporter permease n=1 Tax=Paenibacillus thalictri TaxID=2527873 RepID=A0A4Q9DMX6_9BACL|nr:ABC transporter permease subunit [Paenibacillus thalictri]TBL76657.1 sugar ABC transporter permease [Paenibacillus thalictri]